MNRRSAIAIIVSTAALVMPVSAQAQGNGNGNGNDGGNGNGNGNGNDTGNGNNGNGNANGHDDSNAGGSGNGNANGHNKGNNGSSNDGSANGQGQGNKSEGPSPATADDDVELSESEVLAAVRTGSAVSLETLLPDVRTRTGGEIINAQLQQSRGFLLYAVTVLTPEGKVVTEYYYARSGMHVGN